MSPSAVPAVTGVTARPVSSSAINVQWMYSTPCVDRFIVIYKRDSEFARIISESNVTSRSVDLTGLADLQGTYSISMQAMYQSVTSADSNTVIVTFRSKGIFM